MVPTMLVFAALSLAPGALARIAMPRQANDPVLFFNGIPSQTTCTQVSFGWVYAGPTSPMTLSITNINVPQSPPPNTLTDNDGRAVPTGAGNPPAPTVSTAVASIPNPRVNSFTWPKVAVAQGWYVLQASIPDFSYLAVSPSFFVANGSDTSCFAPPRPSSSTPTSTRPTPTSSSTSHKPSTSTSSTASPGAAFPVSDTASGSTVNTGAIAGGVVGGVVLIALALLAFILLRRKSSSQDNASGAGFGAGLKRTWGGLGSVDSTISSRPRPHSQHARMTSYQGASASAGFRGAGARMNSFGAVAGVTSTASLPATEPDSGHTVAMGHTTYRNSVIDRVGADEKLRMNGRVSASTSKEELRGVKSPFSDPVSHSSLPPSGDVVPATGPVMDRSVSSLTTAPSTSPSPVIGFVPGMKARKPSVDAPSVSALPSLHTHTASASASGPPSAYPPTPTSPSAYSPSHAHYLPHNLSLQHIGTGPPENGGIQRSASQQGAGGRGRRKPVPTYDPGVATANSSASSSPAEKSPLSDGPPAYMSDDMHNNQELDVAELHGLTLQHKNSLVELGIGKSGGGAGGKMHYLIPDMPSEHMG